MDGNIFVVEDDSEIQELLAANLRYAGYAVTCVATVASAEALLSQGMPDLIVLDWVLPDTLGVTFARRLRADLPTRNVAFVMLSVRSREADRVMGLEAGADDYITKPFHPRELQLLNEVWGSDACVEERTVDVHVRLLRHALAATCHASLIETVRGAGYRFAYEVPMTRRVLAQRTAGERHARS